MIKTVIFDLDGTLLDTLEDLYQSVNRALIKFNYPTHTREEVCSFIGTGVRALVKKAMPENAENLDECLEFFREDYALHKEDNTRPYPHIIEVLEELNRQKITCLIVSNKVDGAVKELSEKYFGSLIAIAVGESPETQKKPAPDMVFKALAEVGLDTKDALFIGDGETDILTAKNASIPCIAVTWGFRDKDFLKENGATVFANTPLEILELIKTY